MPLPHLGSLFSSKRGNEGDVTALEVRSRSLSIVLSLSHRINSPRIQVIHRDGAQYRVSKGSPRLDGPNSPTREVMDLFRRRLISCVSPSTMLGVENSRVVWRCAVNEQTTAKQGFLASVTALIGPAAIMTAGIMGAGSTVSLLTAGCYFQYSLLWAIFLSLPVIVVCQDTASRIGAQAGGKGMMRIIADETNPVLMWLIVIPVLFTCMTANIGQLGAMAAATSNLINLAAQDDVIPAEPSLAINAVLLLSLAAVSLLINATGGYKRTEKVMSYLLSIILLCFLIVAVQAFVHFSEIKLMLAGLMPRIPEDVVLTGAKTRSGFLSFCSIIGGGVAATAILSFPYFTTEGGYTMGNIRSQFRKHVILLGVVFGFYSCILLISGGYALFPLPDSASFQDAKLVGKALAVLGPAGPIFFSIGLLICAFTTLVVVAQLAAYFVLDCLGMNWRFQQGNRAYLLVFCAFVILPAIVGAFWTYPALLKVVISMVFNCLVSPLAILLIIFLINRRPLIGPLKASPLRNLFLVYSMAVVLFTGFVAVKGLWAQLAQITGL